MSYRRKEYPFSLVCYRFSSDLYNFGICSVISMAWQPFLIETKLAPITLKDSPQSSTISLTNNPTESQNIRIFFPLNTAFHYNYRSIWSSHQLLIYIYIYIFFFFLLLCCFTLWLDSFGIAVGSWALVRLSYSLAISH